MAGKKNFKVINFIGLFFAGIINAVGVTMFLAPVELYDSGFSGTAMLLWLLTPSKFTLSLFLVVLNVPFFYTGLSGRGLCLLFTRCLQWLCIPFRPI